MPEAGGERVSRVWQAASRELPEERMATGKNEWPGGRTKARRENKNPAG